MKNKNNSDIMGNIKPQRIEYIDALRGVTIIMVVLTHVASANGVDTLGKGNFHSLFLQFRMPLFFFISGFLFYKENLIWNWRSFCGFLRKKIPVQIVSPFIFLLCYIYYCDLSFKGAMADEFKAGYWFTFTLFSFFVLYIILDKVLDFFKIKKCYHSGFNIALGFFLYFFCSYAILVNWIGAELNATGLVRLLGLPQLKYFIFFVIGVCVKKNFGTFLNILDCSPLLPMMIVIYFSVNLFVDLQNVNVLVRECLELLLAISGVVILFAVFRKHNSFFKSDNRAAKSIKFIGRRTLDIYLLHSFFLYPNLKIIYSHFAGNCYPLYELVVSLIIASMVITACLLVSAVLRCNNEMTRFLFGEKRK